MGIIRRLPRFRRFNQVSPSGGNKFPSRHDDRNMERSRPYRIFTLTVLTLPVEYVGDEKCDENALGDESRMTALS